MNRVEHVMGLPVSLRIDDTYVPGDIADAVFAWLHEADARFSPFKPDSEVSRLNHGELSPAGISADLAHVLDLGEGYLRASGGTFDMRLPGRGIDPCARGQRLVGAARRRVAEGGRGTAVLPERRRRHRGLRRSLARGSTPPRRRHSALHGP